MLHLLQNSERVNTIYEASLEDVLRWGKPHQPTDGGPN
jgi:hypothetical protein